MILALAGYLGIVIGLRMLAKVDRQARTVQTLAQSVADTSAALLAQIHAMLGADRPWLLAAVEPAPESAACFNIMISNRGRAPAEIISLTDRIAIVGGQECLPHSPEYSEESLKKTTSPLILVPGEFAVIQTFAQNDLDWICKTEESRRRIEIASDHIYLHGRVTYRNLTSQNGDKPYVTDWCCKYIPDRSNSRLAVTGPPEYIKHS